MRALSFRARLALTMKTLILVISIAIWIYVPRKFEQEGIALVAHQAETLANLTAFTINPAIYFRDRIALDEALRGTRQDKDVAYVVVMDAAGNRLSSFHPERASATALARRTSGGGVSSDRSLYEVMTPIRDRGQELARLYIGMSLARLSGEIAKMRFGIGLLSLFILGAGLIAVVLISNVMTRPLRHVAAGAQRIAAGELSHRVPEGSGDEIGRLAGAFNDMAAKVAERDTSLRHSHEQLRMLSKRLLSIQEQERIRISREVHDELGQALTALKIDLQQLGMGNESLQDPLRQLARAIDQIIELVRRIATDLRPSILDDLGVTASLEQQLRRLRESSGLRTQLTVSGEPQLDMLTGVTIYRIVQEALANVMRHAHAGEVKVSLAIDATAAVLEIRDDGRGMTPEQIADSRSLGLIGIRERAELLGGSFAIQSRPGEGTVLTVTLPKEDRDASSAVR